MRQGQTFISIIIILHCWRTLSLSIYSIIWLNLIFRVLIFYDIRMRIYNHIGVKIFFCNCFLIIINLVNLFIVFLFYFTVSSTTFFAFKWSELWIFILFFFLWFFFLWYITFSLLYSICSKFLWWILWWSFLYLINWSLSFNLFFLSFLFVCFISYYFTISNKSIYILILILIKGLKIFTML